MDGLFDIKGKVALVTGGASGIGLMIARGYVEAGARVYIASRKLDACEKVAAELSQAGDCQALGADLSTAEGCRTLAGQIAERESALHILVNNAGATWGAPLNDYPESGWDKVMNTNVRGVFFLTQALLPQLEAAASAEDPARVLNVGSIDGLKPPMLESYAYSASKAAVHQLTRHLAKRLAAQHITVNAIAPGPFQSRMMAATIEAFEDVIVGMNPLGRLGRPEDMAGVAIYLASRAGSYVTGAVIPVDGGMAALT